MCTSLKIAWRFLTKNKLQSLVIILAISVAVSVQIFIGLLSQGLERTLLFKVVGNSPHVTIYSHKGGIENWQDKKNKINSLGKEIKAVAPEIDRQAYVKLNDMTEPILMRGFIPEDANALYDIKNKIFEGKMFEKDNEAILGNDLKSRLGIKAGDKINIVTPWGKNEEFTVTGFFDLGNIKLNKTWVITNLNTVQRFANLQESNKVTSIEIGIRDLYNADVEGKKIENVLEDKNLKAENWKDQNKLIVSGIMGQRVCTVVIQFFVLLASVLSIISVLGISVVQKYKEIGILKAIGLKDGKSGAIFFFQAFIIGVLGTIAGIGLSMLYIKGFNKYIITQEGRPVVDIIISQKFIIKSALISIAASTCAAVFPAFKSFKLSPVEVIKNG
jgi:lipoprotein-releasing system permease protein